MKRALILTISSTIAALSACGFYGGFANVRQEFHYSYALQPRATLQVENTNGEIQVAGWDRETIDVSGTKAAASEDRLGQIHPTITVDPNGKSASVITNAPHFLPGSWYVNYLIRVPRRITITRAHSTNGNISAEDLEGGGRIESTNGKISLARDRGDYDVETTNGNLSLEECIGRQKVESTNGSINGHLKTGSIRAQSVNGGVDVTILSPENGQPISATTTNGGVTLALAQFVANPVHVQTTNGSVTLHVPETANAHVELPTGMGGITNDLTLRGDVHEAKHDVSGQLGEGGPRISLTSSMGSVHLQRY
ncbi:MAG: DUF4097 family beta strand repeat protein [Acidobacteriaceae bacterium]|nr:DUF4097 family beta strand repeat protein [Acidobacteriaceae bacterium]